MKKLDSSKAGASSLGPKWNSTRRLLCLAVAALLCVAFTRHASAATLYWDADGAGSGNGGTGTWDTIASLWRLSGTTGALQTYTNTGAATTAVFGGSAGTVTIAAGTTINANALIFKTSGYTIAGSNGTSILNLDGTTPTITTGAGNTATISANITGTAGLTKANDNGTLILSGSNTYTGSTTIYNGTVVLDMNAGGSLNSASTLTLGGPSAVGNFQVKGKNGTASSQTLGTLNGALAGSSVIKLTPGTGGGSVNLTLGNTWNRTGAFTLNIDLSAGNSTLTSSPLMQNGVISGDATAGRGGWVTVTDATSTGFGTVDGSGHVVRLTATTHLGAASASGTVNYITKVGDAGYVGNTLTFTGNQTPNTLQLDSSAGAGVLNLGGYTLSVTNKGLLMTGANDYTIQNGSIAPAYSDLIVHQYGTGALTLNSPILGGGSGRLIKVGPGMLILGGTNTYTGGTYINGGTLRATDGIGLSGSGALTLQGGVFETGVNFTRTYGSGAGAAVIAGGTSGFSAYGGPVKVALGGTTAPTALSYVSSGWQAGTLVLNASTANNTLNFMNAMDLYGADRSINVNSSGTSTAATISGVISNSTGTGGVVKGGAGILALTGTNTYNGATSVQNGTLSFSTVASGTARQSLGSGATVNLGSPGLNGILQYTGATAGTLDKTVNALGAGGDTITNSGSGLLTLSGPLNTNATQLGLNGGTKGISVTGTISGSSLVLTGGTTTLAAANTYNGSTTVQGGGTLGLATNGSISNSSTITVFAGSKLDVSAKSSYSIPASQTLKNYGTVNGNLSVGGVLNGTGNVTGYLSLVSGGQLLTGTSPGTQTVGGNLTLLGGSKFTMQLLTAGSGGTLVGGVDYDQLLVGGNVSLSGTLALTLGGVMRVGDVFNLILDSGTASSLTGGFSAILVNGTSVSNYTGSKFTYGGQDYTIATANADGSGAANDLQLVAVSDDPLMAFGVNEHPCLYNGEYGRPNDYAALCDGIIASGIKLVRMDVGWSWLSQTRGTYNTARRDVLDDIVHRLSAGGVQISCVLISTAYWASSNVSDPQWNLWPPTNYQDWADWVNWMCVRYNNQITYWEVWNEPDHGGWLGTLPEYYTLLQTAATQIRAVNPNNVVLMAGLACTGTEGTTYFNGLLALGAANYFDVINYHTYGSNNVWKSTYAGMKTVIDNNNLGSRKIWITETGYTTYGNATLETAKADYTDNAYGSLFSMDPNIEKVFMYTNRNTFTLPSGNALQDNFGLLTYATRAPLPAFYHYQAAGGDRSNFAMQKAYPSTEARRTLNYVVTGTGDGSFITDYDTDGSSKQIASSTYMYFQVNDAWTYDYVPQNQLYVDVTYLDSGNGQWALQYDGTSNSYQSSGTMTKTNTGGWLTQRFTLNDPKFANRQNYASDFRLAASTADLIVSDVKVSRDDTVAWATLAATGTSDKSWQMWRVQNSGTTGSSYNPIVTQGGVPCREILDNGKFINLWVAENVVLPTDTNVTFTVTFWDAGTDNILIQYNAISSSYKSIYIAKTNTNAWRTVSSSVTDAKFLDTINTVGDLWIGNGGDGSVEYVSMVNVKLTP